MNYFMDVFRTNVTNSLLRPYFFFSSSSSSSSNSSSSNANAMMAHAHASLRQDFNLSTKVWGGVSTTSS
jgi:hypothetical protein